MNEFLWSIKACELLHVPLFSSNQKLWSSIYHLDCWHCINISLQFFLRTFIVRLHWFMDNVTAIIVSSVVAIRWWLVAPGIAWALFGGFNVQSKLKTIDMITSKLEFLLTGVRPDNIDRSITEAKIAYCTSKNLHRFIMTILCRLIESTL